MVAVPLSTERPRLRSLQRTTSQSKAVPLVRAFSTAMVSPPVHSLASAAMSWQYRSNVTPANSAWVDL